MEEGYLLKEFYNEKLVKTIAADLGRAWPPFDREGFVESILPALEHKSLTERAMHITETMYRYLPASYGEALEILLASFGPELKANQVSGMEPFYYLPHANYVACYGLEHFELSMNALLEITKRFTAEGAIRPFIQRYPEQTLRQLSGWAKDKNVHVRRLVSEGTRPRLPWASHLEAYRKDPRPVIALLEQLKTDPELYVRRSVANNINDITKDNPGIALQTLKQWATIDDEGTQWIIRHSLRSLVKQADPQALRILGYPVPPKVKLERFELRSDRIKLGENLEFELVMVSEAKKNQALMLDYRVHFMKANGKLAPKVFKLSKKALKPGERIHLSKKHPIKPISTRKYYPGTHRLELQVNGQKMGDLAFELII